MEFYTIICWVVWFFFFLIQYVSSVCIFVFISVTLFSIVSNAVQFENEEGKETLGWNLRQNTDA